MQNTLTLGIPGFQFADLYNPYRLRDLLGIFDEQVRSADPKLFEEFTAYRNGAQLTGPAESSLLIRVSPFVSSFVAKLFNVEREVAELKARTAKEDPVLTAKREFFVRRAFKKGQTPTVLTGARLAELKSFVRACGTLYSCDTELGLATAIVELLAAETNKQPTPEPIAKLTNNTDAAQLLKELEGWAQVEAKDHHSFTKEWVLFRAPHLHALNFQELVPIRRKPDLHEMIDGLEEHRRRRDGFKLTDPRMTMRQALGEVEYCIYCHDREKDSCSTGLKEKNGVVKKNALGIDLNGCPLDEKISEAHVCRKDGNVLGALAMIVIDNPMLPGTGHRICNDCMKACIYQKQEPVNIPQIETSVLTDVLKLPWGFEIWSFLTRFNPLNVKRPTPRPYSGKNVLVVGLGPAGYTLSHYLANEGFGVVGVDGLKLEPMPEKLLQEPIRDISTIAVALDERPLTGFGGVSEYGITVRWDKNFLTMLYLNLLRRDRIWFFGGLRFGGTFTIEDCWDLGFDHIAIATGAGKPTLIDLKNNLIRGIRKASDFLMALQLTGAFKKTSIANLQIELPVVVIGGGLTAIDTATEALAYYPIQVERALDRYEALSAEQGEDNFWKMYDEEEKRIMRKFIEHGKAIREERARAKSANEEPNFAPLVRSWGGVSMAYRKKMIDSPAYRLNHEEVFKALEESIFFGEELDPIEAHPDEFGAVNAITFKRTDKSTVTMPARSVLVAAGTSPNIIYEKEYPGTFELDAQKRFFKNFNATREGDQVTLTASNDGMFTSYIKDNRTISYYGDNHPRFAGNVVKAMASAKHGYSFVSALFLKELTAAESAAQGTHDAIWNALRDKMEDNCRARVVKVERLTPTIIDVIVRAPFAAKKFQPGQFYRLQNYENTATVVEGTKLLMEGLALTGAWVDVEKGLLSMIVLEMGGSSRLCSLLKPGEEVLVMGPTGTPTEIPQKDTALLVGGGLGNAVLFSIARKLREEGSKVIYFAGYRKKEDFFKREEIEAATDVVVWSVDGGEMIEAKRPQDRSFRGNIVQAMLAYSKGELGEVVLPLSRAGRIIAIGSDRMMAAVQKARHEALKPFLNPNHIGIGSINSPMQCMMKEVCAQCLQKHKDPETGKETVVFSCFNQDQELDRVDWKNLNERLKTNSVLEKLTNAWVDRLLRRGNLGPYAPSNNAQAAE
jgi:NADPH-dependent glutamate synthase beta subunit-like oxidoreductase/NAD(P)H-flavin reductase